MTETSEITLRSDFDVDLVDAMGTDAGICRAARVSTLGMASLDTDESVGLLRFLMKNRHGSPFEHGSLMFRISAPIFVWREFMRHRIGFSYNEQSGRYMELEPMFYMPLPSRNIIQQGKPGAYEFVPGSVVDYDNVRVNLAQAYDKAWKSYKFMIEHGIAKEVARMCLPVATYSTAYVTCNPRSLMHFLSLRTKHDNAAFPSYPMYEIQQVANAMEEIFTELFPITQATFDAAGRVCP